MNRCSFFFTDELQRFYYIALTLVIRLLEPDLAQNISMFGTISHAEMRLGLSCEPVNLFTRADAALKAACRTHLFVSHCLIM